MLTTLHSQIVVAGRLRLGVSRVRPSVGARARDGPHQLPVTRLDSRDPFYASLRENYIARMWAYLMLQDFVLSSTLQEVNRLHRDATERPAYDLSKIFH
ncbi:hypothetical protein E2C01_054275 [Portunus trituberculatus]|uniref:Uncharacterized protein n=1 Tax=Portunus trituberculatus TaxID=210409 RepID=A0A5B7GRI6_PORTR|nr:hypothetical protein [Portunus trituberculatus]